MGVDVNMLATTTASLSEQDVRNLSYRLCEAFGYETFWLDVKAGQFALSIVKPDDYPCEWLPLEARTTCQAGTILIVNQGWRYYGPGYERGPLPTILAVAEWLTRNGLQVWYGSDSHSSVSLLDAVAKEELWNHFAKNGGEPYRSGFGGRDPKLDCPYCINPMRVTTWGPYEQRSYVCPGCGYACTRSPEGVITVDKEPAD